MIKRYYECSVPRNMHTHTSTHHNFYNNFVCLSFILLVEGEIQELQTLSSMFRILIGEVFAQQMHMISFSRSILGIIQMFRVFSALPTDPIAVEPTGPPISY